MPRRSILSAAERESLLALPDSKDDLIRHYTFNDTDLSIIRQRRGPANRLGFAVQLCYLRFPGVILGVDELPFLPLLKLVADQLKVGVESWNEYGQREQTRREHLSELQTVFGFRPFTMSHYRQAVQMLTELAMQTDKGIVLASALIGHLRRQSVILPALNAVERASAEAITRANRRIYDALAEPLADAHRRRLDDLLKRRDNGKTTWLAWLRQSPAKPNSRHMLEHIERLKAWQALDLPTGIERLVHQNRLLKIAREGGQMTPADLAKFEPQRRYATLVALATEGMATVTDEIIDLHDRILGKLFNAAKNKHQQQFQASGKAINAKVRLYGRIGQALIDAKQSGRDAFAAIEAVMSWDSFAESVTEAQKLAQPDDFDFLHRIGESYATLRRYAPEFLAVLKLRAAPAAKNVLDAIEVLRGMNTDNARKLPADAPTGFIKPRIRDLGDTKLYIPKGDAAYDALKPMIGGTLNIKHVRAHWDEILRLATSIKQGTVTASLMLRKLGSYPRQNGLAVALRELGRIERTLFILDWLQSVELRRRVHAGLNKGEARNALARAVFFNRLGEIRDRSFEQQRYRASGLNLVTAAIVLWNTVYLERAAHALRGNGHAVDDSLLQYLSPLGWEHINLTGDYLWRSSAKIGAGKFRPLRPLQPA
ncbi:Tn3 family transposase [Klebsiella pneumoniae]|uniref:Tn3 family transposase n=1 Tax=Klebsiella pneumoniae TaxID=573 RepID=UPI0015E64D26|nr:Tn3 family transposase [Klebsiella pneumoniae]